MVSLWSCDPQQVLVTKGYSIFDLRGGGDQKNKSLWGEGGCQPKKNRGRGCTKFWEIMLYGGRNCPHTRFLDHPYPPYNIFIPPYNIFIPPYNIFQKSCRGGD